MSLSVMNHFFYDRNCFDVARDLLGQVLVSTVGGEVTSQLFIDPGENVSNDRVMAASRVGVGYAGEYANLPWRLYLKDNLYVSKKDKNALSYSEVPEGTFGPML